MTDYADQRAHDVAWMTAAEREAWDQGQLARPGTAQPSTGDVSRGVAPRARLPVRLAAGNIRHDRQGSDITMTTTVAAN